MSDADALLARWQQRLATISANANALHDAEFSTRIRNRLRDGRYTGLTLERAGRALAGLTALMDDYLILARVVDEAAEAARGGLFQSRDATDARVRALLEESSVALPAVHVPLQQRDLLTDASRVAMTTPAAVLDAMQAAFCEARDGLTAIDQAEQGVDTGLAKARLALAELAARAAGLGIDEPAPVWQQADAIQQDPLAQLGALRAFEARIAAWRATVDAAEHERNQVQQALTEARDRLGLLHTRIAERPEARALLRKLLGEVPEQAEAAALADAHETLATWLGNLERTALAGSWHAAATGLTRFAPALATQLALADQLIQAVQAPVNAYADLKARFKVLRTKAATLRERGQLDGSDETEAAIADAFRARPADLPTLSQRVAEFEHQLLMASQHA
ncbi:MAG: hypothetical protein JO142_13745 [Burkholderiales bacterium]|nr:hypothetical protein [Burkholderiales bacterium]